MSAAEFRAEPRRNCGKWSREGRVLAEKVDFGRFLAEKVQGVPMFGLVHFGKPWGEAFLRVHASKIVPK